MGNGTLTAPDVEPGVETTTETEPAVNLSEGRLSSADPAAAAESRTYQSAVLDGLDSDTPLRELDTVEEIRAIDAGTPDLSTPGTSLNGLTRSDLSSPFAGRNADFGGNPTGATTRNAGTDIPADWHTTVLGAAVWNTIEPSDLVGRPTDVNLSVFQKSPHQELFNDLVAVQEEVAALREHVAVLEKFRDTVRMTEAELRQLEVIDGRFEDKQIAAGDKASDLLEKISKLQADGKPTDTLEKQYRNDERAWPRTERDFEKQYEALDRRIFTAREKRVDRLVPTNDTAVATELKNLGKNPNGTINPNTTQCKKR